MAARVMAAFPDCPTPTMLAKEWVSDSSHTYSTSTPAARSASA
ncbi:MAG: hypothetical protein ACR2KL_11245 [Nocardioidaceae bacterium]